jgi:hypothetical protein
MHTVWRNNDVIADVKYIQEDQYKDMIVDHAVDERQPDHLDF